MTKRDLAIIAKGFGVGKNEFAKAHERMETSEKKGAEEKVVVGRQRGKGIENAQEIGVGER